MKFGLVLRAYAPFKMFGGPFHGDGRGPTTASNVTSRIKSWVEFDPTLGVVGSPHAKSDVSRLVFETPIFAPRATAVSFARVSSVKTGRSSVYFQLHAWGEPAHVRGRA